MASKLNLPKPKTLLLAALLTLSFGIFNPCFSADLLLFAGAGMRQPTDRVGQNFREKTPDTGCV